MSEKTKKIKNKVTRNLLDFQTMQQTMLGFKKIVKSELKAQLTFSSVFVIAMSLIFPTLTAILGNPLDQNEVATYSRISQTLGQSSIYAILNRIGSVFSEKMALQRNRAMYLRYGKNQVLFGKLLVDVGFFIAPMIITTTIGTIVTIYKNNGKLPTGFVESIFTYFIAVILLCILLTNGVKWALTSIHRKLLKGIVIAAILIFTGASFVIVGLIQTEVKDSAGNLVIMDTIVNNKFVFSFVPILNIIALPMTVSGRMEAWNAVPFIVQAAIIIALFWSSLAKNLKLHLTT